MMSMEPRITSHSDRSSKLGTEIIGEDLGATERVTVHEQGSKLRSVGVATKSCKSDLGSTLRGFPNRRGSVVLDDPQLSGTKPKFIKTDALKGKTKSSFVEEHALELNPVLKVSEIQSTERSVKQVQAAANKSSFLLE